MSIVQTVESTLLQAFKNGMSIRQVSTRLPAVIAKKLGVTTGEFHRQFNLESKETIDQLVLRVASQLTPEEQQRALREI